MKQELLAHYLAYLAYRDRMNGLPGYEKRVSTAAAAIADSGRFEAQYRWCEIRTDWVDILEDGLDYIQNAINEQRQFITKDGSVVPIEKARRVSKESTIHLAKHSELLSGATAEHVTPEKIYVKENQSNFLVYENRFLYMALCYLRDFVDIRYQGILDADNTYDLHLTLDASHTTVEKKHTFALSYREQNADGSCKEVSEQNLPIFARIQGIRFAISSYLNTELMTEVSRAPMLKPPVTPTNVLRMDNDFREVFRLYTTVISYPDSGYTVHERKVSHVPLPVPFAEDLTRMMFFCSFLADMYGNDTAEALREQAEAKAVEARKKALSKEAERLADLQARIGGDRDAYLSALEQYALSLEAQKQDWLAVAGQNETLRFSLTAAEKSYAALKETYDGMQKTYDDLHRESHLALEREKENTRMALTEAKEQLTSKLKEKDRIHTEKTDTLQAEILALKQNLAEANDRLAAAAEQNLILSAKLHARQPDALMPEHMDEAAFNALECEKRAYDRFFEKQWKKAKAEIRQEHLWGTLKKKKPKHKPEQTDKGDTNE